MYYKNRFTPVLFHFMYLRDTYFTGNEDLYYGPEMVATMIASAGTATFRSFNMGSEINASEIARYERDITFESRNDTKTLFRGERANVVPDDVFQNGFKPMGTHNDALLHTKSNATAGNFVSTSGDKAIATEFASNNGYVYVILADNYVDINSTYGANAYFPEEMEFSIPGGIKPSEIVGAYKKQGGKIIGDFISNPNFGGN